MDSCLFDEDRSSFSALTLESDNAMQSAIATDDCHNGTHRQHVAEPDPASFLVDNLDTSSASAFSSAACSSSSVSDSKLLLSASSSSVSADACDSLPLWHSDDVSAASKPASPMFVSTQHDDSLQLLPDSDALRLDSASYALADDTALDSHNSASSSATLSISTVAGSAVSSDKAVDSSDGVITEDEENEAITQNSMVGKLRGSEDDGVMMKLEEEDDKPKGGFALLDHPAFPPPMRRRWASDGLLEMSTSTDYEYDENADNLSSASSNDSRADGDDDALAFGLEEVASDDGSQTSSSNSNSHSPMSSPQLSPLTDDEFASESLTPANSPPALLKPLFAPSVSMATSASVAASAPTPASASASASTSSSSSILSLTRAMVTRVLLHSGKRWLSHAAIAASAAQQFPEQYQQFLAGCHPVFSALPSSAAVSSTAEERWAALLAYPLTIASAMDEGLQAEGLALEKQRRRKEEGAATEKKRRRKKSQKEEDEKKEEKEKEKDAEKPKKRVTFHVYRVVPLQELRKAAASTLNASKKRARKTSEDPHLLAALPTALHEHGEMRAHTSSLLCSSADPSDGDLIRSSLRCLLLSHSPQWLSSSHLTDLLKSSPMADQRLHSSFLSFFQRKRSMGVTEEKANKEWKDRVMRLLKSMVKGWSEEGWRLETQRRTHGGVGLSYRVMKATEKMDEDSQQVEPPGMKVSDEHDRATPKRVKLSVERLPEAEVEDAEDDDLMKEESIDFTAESHNDDFLSVPNVHGDRSLSPTTAIIGASPRTRALLHSNAVLTPVLHGSVSPLLSAVAAPVALPAAVIAEHSFPRKSTVLASFDKSDLLATPLGLNTELSLPPLSMPATAASMFHAAAISTMP